MGLVNFISTISLLLFSRWWSFTPNLAVKRPVHFISTHFLSPQSFLLVIMFTKPFAIASGLLTPYLGVKEPLHLVFAKYQTHPKAN